MNLALIGGVLLCATPFVGASILIGRELGMGEVLLAWSVVAGVTSVVALGVYMVGYGLTGEWVTP